MHCKELGKKLRLKVLIYFQRNSRMVLHNFGQNQAKGKFVWNSKQFANANFPEKVCYG